MANDLQLARERTATVAPISSTHPLFGFDDAYEVARLLTIGREASGSIVCGFKIGLTYLPTWERIGVEAPFWAAMYCEGVEQSSTLSLAGLASPRLEPEVVVGLRSPLAPGATADDIESAIEWMALGFEVVDSHYPQWKATPADLVADHGCHAGLRLGAHVGFRAGAPGHLAGLRVELWCDADLVATGNGTDVLGGPIESIARCLAMPNGPRVGAGELISTGSLTGRSHPVAAGQHWQIVPLGTSLFPTLDLAVR